ncbi:MAG: hypothetical protein ACFFDW_12790 [Candidatus Thorarchaeota archaeon]
MTGFIQYTELPNGELEQNKSHKIRNSNALENSLISLPLVILTFVLVLIILLKYLTLNGTIRIIIITTFIDSMIVVVMIFIYILVKFLKIKKSNAYKEGIKTYRENRATLKIKRIILSISSLLIYAITLPGIYVIRDTIVNEETFLLYGFYVYLV